ncbi:putative Anaphase-promoting complex subunit CDC26 [Seiridium cardinale]
MLRRPPTTLTLTSEDIAIYEDRRSREASQRRTNNPAVAHRYDSEELLANNHHHQHPYSHLPSTHPKRRTILDPPAAQSSSAAAQSRSGWDAASEQDLRNFAQQRAQQRRQQQHRADGASHGVHFTPLPRGGSIPPPQNGAGLGVSDAGAGDDSDFPNAALSSPPEASPLLQSSSDDDREDEDEEGSPEDEEMEDYDAPGHLQALPRSARPTVYAQQHQQVHHSYPPTAAANLQTPVNPATGAQGGQGQQQQHTPIPSNHGTAAVSQIPQAPQRRGHGRTVSSRIGSGRGAGTNEAQAQAQPPPAPTRLTRSREERNGAPGAGTRRPGR